jgi:hypothetical protein
VPREADAVSDAAPVNPAALLVQSSDARVYFDPERGKFFVSVGVRGAFVPRHLTKDPVENDGFGAQFVCFEHGERGGRTEVNACYRVDSWSFEIELKPRVSVEFRCLNCGHSELMGAGAKLTALAQCPRCHSLIEGAATFTATAPDPMIERKP